VREREGEGERAREGEGMVETHATVPGMWTRE
jgi:hypothetical protein